METRPIRFKIFRYRPGRTDPPRFQIFELSIGPQATVLDALEALRIEQDPSLLYRHSCHHSSCGTCACRINGIERLACVTRVRDLGGEEVVLEPLEGFERVGDLVVDMRPLYEEIPSGVSCHRESEWNPGASVPEGLARYERFENCIECGACLSACPVSGDRDAFLGPAALAAISREIEKGAGHAAALLDLAGSDRGVWRCERAMVCSKVCPVEVYPARHIHELRLRLKRKEEESR
jgi:succinate dehydrogenase / fumarate reductase iron-sulfur subunit